MRANDVETAEAEARRFLERVATLRRMQGEGLPSSIPGDRYYEGSPYTAAVRRASMDLTRALAAVRR